MQNDRTDVLIVGYDTEGDLFTQFCSRTDRNDTPWLADTPGIRIEAVRGCVQVIEGHFGKREPIGASDSKIGTEHVLRECDGDDGGIATARTNALGAANAHCIGMRKEIGDEQRIKPLTGYGPRH
jgi:hypothetical protein